MLKDKERLLIVVLIGIIFMSSLIIDKSSYKTIIRQVFGNRQITSIKVMYQMEKAEIYPEIKVVCNERLKYGNIKIKGVGGTTKLDDKQLIYYPNRILDEMTKYDVEVKLITEKDNKEINEKFSFKTKDVREDKMWVEVSLIKENNKVYIRKGKEIIKEFMCSGGTEEEPSIYGTYYLENRGSHFYSERFKEGAKYWVRIKDQYLFHSIPRDKDGNIIQSELEKIGREASHGCIRLLDEDAKWFYDNVPDGTMVIIHN